VNQDAFLAIRKLMTLFAERSVIVPWGADRLSANTEMIPVFVVALAVLGYWLIQFGHGRNGRQ